MGLGRGLLDLAGWPGNPSCERGRGGSLPEAWGAGNLSVWGFLYFAEVFLQV